MQSACAVLYCHLWPVWMYSIFTHYLMNGTILGANVIEHKMCVLTLYTNLFETFLILRRMQWGIIINVYSTSCKVSVILVRFLWHLNFLDILVCLKNSQISNFTKILQVGAQLCHANGQTDVTKRFAVLRTRLNANKLILYREIIAVCFQIHTKHINTLCGQNVGLYIKIQSVPRSKHTPSRL